MPKSTTIRAENPQPPVSSPYPVPVGALLFSDEFVGAAGAQPSSTRWNAKTATSSSSLAHWNGWGQIALDGASNVVITLDFVGGVWLSGWMTGVPAASQYSGPRYMEVRANVPSGTGTWNSPLWEWNAPFGSAPGIENDCIEQLGRQPMGYNTTLHNWNGTTNPVNGFLNTTAVTIADDWHTFGAAVYSNRVDYYFDRVLVRSILTSSVGLTNEFVTTTMTVNCSMNVGGWAGTPTFTPPVTMLVDYLRIFALA